MRKLNCEFLTKEKINELYNETNERDKKNEAEYLYKVARKDPLISFYFSVLFSKYVDIVLEDFFIRLLDSPRISMYLIYTHLGIKTNPTMIQDTKDKIEAFASTLDAPNSSLPHIDPNANVLKVKFYSDELPLDVKTIRFLLQIELGCEKIHKVDQSFLSELFGSISQEERLKIANDYVSPIKCMLSKVDEFKEVFLNSQQGYFYDFVSKVDLLPSEALLKCNTLPYDKIHNVLRNTHFNFIQKHITNFYTVYPELKTFEGKLYPNRMEYLKNPFSLPMERRVLTTYLNIDYTLQESISNITKRLTEEFNEEVVYYECTSYLHLFYIRKIFNEGSFKLFRSVVNELILGNENTFKLFINFILTQSERPDITKILDEIIPLLPCLKTHFDILMETTIAKRNDLLFNLLGKVIRTFPVRANIEKTKQSRYYLTEEFVTDHDYLMKKL